MQSLSSALPPTLQVDGKVDDIVLEHKLDAIICVAGGWAGGNAASAGNDCTCRHASLHHGHHVTKPVPPCDMDQLWSLCYVLLCRFYQKL